MGYGLCLTGYWLLTLDILRAYWLDPIMKNGLDSEQALAWFDKYLLLGWLHRKFYHRLYRDKEKGKVSSLVWVILGYSVSYIMFSDGIAVLAVSYMAADPAAKYIGMKAPSSRRFRRGPATGKSWDGCTAGFITCIGISILIWNIDLCLTEPLFIDFSRYQYFTMSLIGSFTAVVFEAISGKKDNFVMPVSAAIAMWLVTLTL
ncbi:hypothetical protein KJ641_01370 [Patescibacteria group bacterium]|nr:hypothetical protein [Patescibacteria group bacterium]